MQIITVSGVEITKHNVAVTRFTSLFCWKRIHCIFFISLNKYTDFPPNIENKIKKKRTQKDKTTNERTHITKTERNTQTKKQNTNQTHN